MQFLIPKATEQPKSQEELKTKAKFEDLTAKNIHFSEIKIKPKENEK